MMNFTQLWEAKLDYKNWVYAKKLMYESEADQKLRNIDYKFKKWRMASLFFERKDFIIEWELTIKKGFDQICIFGTVPKAK